MRSIPSPDPPVGLRLDARFVTPEEEATLLQHLRPLLLEPVVMRGVEARRTVLHFGLRYGYTARELTETLPVPDWLRDLQDRCAAWIGRESADLAEVLVTRYGPGAGIGWHRDAPAFGTVVGVSLAAPCRMRFRREQPDGSRLGWEEPLPPRSAYVLAGSVRWQWQHMIPPVLHERWSITFRTLRQDR